MLTLLELRTSLMDMMQETTYKKFSQSQYNNAVNHAIRISWPWFFQKKIDTTTCIVQDDKLSLTLPTDVKRADDVCEVRVEHAESKDTGTATGTQSGTTLQDTSKSWTVNEFSGMAVATYDGTGSGQQRTITSNTANTLTVPTWTTNPVTADTEYLIKDLNTEWSAWERIYHWRIENNAGSLTLRLPYQYESGMSLLISYITPHTVLTTDASTTDLDYGYIMLAGQEYLYRVWMSSIPENSAEQRKFMMQYSDQGAEKYAILHADRQPSRSITYDSAGIQTVSSDYPF
jgi:hypothetical protein